MNSQIQMSATGIASNAFAQMEFDNEDELEKQAELLIAQLDKLEQSDFMKNSEIEGITDINLTLKEIRNDLSDVIEEKKASTPKITETIINRDSVSMVAYRYYDSLDNVDGLISLNNIQNPKSIEGSMRVYSNVG